MRMNISFGIIRNSSRTQRRYDVAPNVKIQGTPMSAGVYPNVKVQGTPLSAGIARNVKVQGTLLSAGLLRM